MPFEQPRASAGWQARLALRFAARGERTDLVARRHEGPLVVQKALHPEGPGVCHAILVHPPAGIAGGDAIDVRIEAEPGAHALVTTPGAGKWYRSRGPRATQGVRILARDAVVEWLPQETIVFDGAIARTTVDVELCGGASYVGSEIVCLGRVASGERFERGELAMSTRIGRDGATLLVERGRVAGGSALLASPVGFDGEPVVGTLVAASPRANAELVAACREERPQAGRGAVTLLPGVLVARWLGPACEPCRHWFVALWRRLRPALIGREAIVPRIWST